MDTLRERLARVEQQIEAACRAAGRSRADVELMAVSKTHPAEALLELAGFGISVFGENRVQEFQGKAAELGAARSRIRCHLIGHLQSNKAQRAVELFDGVDSVDSLRLAQRLNEAAERVGKRLPVLLEVKLSHEPTKAGMDADSADAAALLEALPSLNHLEMQGLMTIPPFDVAEQQTRACFCALRQLRERWARQHPRLGFNVLSMGMSGDFALAIAEGSTRIRVGTALFGARPPLDTRPRQEPL